jgi:hypothetical protein
MARKRIAKPRQPLSKADQDRADMQAYVDDLLTSKEKCAAFLQRAGIIDKRGRLTKPYRA